MAETLGVALQDHLRQLAGLDIDDLLEQRYRRLMAYGAFQEADPAASLQSAWQSGVAALLGKIRSRLKDARLIFPRKTRNKWSAPQLVVFRLFRAFRIFRGQLFTV